MNAFKSQTDVTFKMKCFVLFKKHRLLSAKIEVDLCDLFSVFIEAPSKLSPARKQ